MAPRFIARQLARPHGLLGRPIGWLMNRHNAAMNEFAFRLLELAPSDRVLEVGFGGGLVLPRLLAGTQFAAGVDRSQDVVSRANARFADAVRAGRADFREGRVEALPFEAASFGKVLTVNTIYFWESLGAGFSEIGRILAPRGRVVVGFLPEARMRRMRMPADIFKLRAPEDVIVALQATGFGSVRVKRPQPSTPWNVIVATRQD
jgi:arsenite methyltransferase